MTNPLTVLEDFRDECVQFRAMVADLTPSQWDSDTPAQGWTIRNQVAHLAFVYNLAATAASDPEQFAELTAPVAKVGLQGAVDHGVEVNSAGSPAEVLNRWDASVSTVTRALSSKDPHDVVPWLVNPLPVHVLTAAGMLELFAHGQDVADALDATPKRTDRLGHLVDFVHRTRDFGYLVNDLQPPNTDLRFEVVLPSGTLHSAGPADASQVIRGTAESLVLVAAKRRHPEDTDLEAQGNDASHWLTIAQAYRGPAGAGRKPMVTTTR